jgi:hypothetical protein
MVGGKGFVGHALLARPSCRTRQNAAKRGKPRNQAQPHRAVCPETSPSRAVSIDGAVVEGVVLKVLGPGSERSENCQNG